MIRPRLIFAGVVLYAFSGAVLSGKGLNSLKPGSQPGKLTADGGDGGDEGDEGDAGLEGSGPQENNHKKPEPSKASLFLQDRLFVTAGSGLSHLKKGSDNWRSGGFGELKFAFDSQIPVLGFRSLGTIRYLPMDVAPNVLIDGIHHEYTGVAEFWLLGGEFRRMYTPELYIIGTAELGMGLVHLKDQVGFHEDSPPDQSGVVFIIGGGVDFAVKDKILFGPRLNLGMGSFTQIQLSAHLTFAF